MPTFSKTKRKRISVNFAYAWMAIFYLLNNQKRRPLTFRSVRHKLKKEIERYRDKFYSSVTRANKWRVELWEQKMYTLSFIKLRFESSDEISRKRNPHEPQPTLHITALDVVCWHFVLSLHAISSDCNLIGFCFLFNGKC